MCGVKCLACRVNFGHGSIKNCCHDKHGILFKIYRFLFVYSLHNLNLAHNFQTPGQKFTKFGGKMYLKEVYNQLGFEPDALKTIAIEINFLIFWFADFMTCTDLTICIRFCENVIPEKIYASISFGHDPVKPVAMPFLFQYLGSWTLLPHTGLFDRF